MKRKNRKALELLEGLIGESVTFGLYLKSIRVSEELSQSEFAAKRGISVQHLCNVENDRKHMSIERASAPCRGCAAGRRRGRGDCRGGKTCANRARTSA